MVDREDEAVERMRAADPAVGSHPDLLALRNKLSRTTPLGLTGTLDDDRAVHVRDATTRGSRASFVAAAAVVALGLGVGGYTLGAQTAAPDDGGTSLAATPSDGGSERVAAPPETLGSEDSASAEGGDMGMGGGEMSYAAGLPVVLTPGPGLSTSGGTGEVKVLQPAETDLEAFLRDWAAELGIEGTVDGDDQYRTLVSDTVTISVYGGTHPSFDYMDSAIDPYCAEIEPLDDGGDADDGTSDLSVLPAPAGCAEISGEPVSEDDAIATARKFLTTAGVDLAGYELKVEDWGGPDNVHNVTGTAPDSEVPDSQWINVTVTPDGVATANAQLGVTVTSMGEYPVVSPVEAVERIGDPRYNMWGSIYVHEDGPDIMPSEPWVEPVWPEVDRTPGAAIPFWIREGTVVQATLAEGVLSLPSGDEFVVPTYLLTDDLGQRHTMVALADEALDFTP